jgi:Kinase binding protein CGI-121
VQAHLSGSIEGVSREFSNAELGESRDLARIRKIYKLNTRLHPKGKKRDADGKEGINGTVLSEEETKELEFAVLGAVALRGAIN